MRKIVDEICYDGAKERIERLGLSVLIGEIRSLLRGFQLLIREQKDSNGGAAVRRMIDAGFKHIGGWSQKVTGDIDWFKCHQVNGTKICLGVEVQVSARSDLLVVDMIHLNNAFREGRIDAGVIIVPSDDLSYFLTDRGPSLSAAKRHVAAAHLDDSPLILIAIEHDGTGEGLEKQPKRKAGRKRTAIKRTK